MEDYFFVLQYGQWLILVISILALYLVSSVHHKTRLKGYLVTALSRFSGAIIFLFVDLFVQLHRYRTSKDLYYNVQS